MGNLLNEGEKREDISFDLKNIVRIVIWEVNILFIFGLRVGVWFFV